MGTVARCGGGGRAMAGDGGAVDKTAAAIRTWFALRTGLTAARMTAAADVGVSFFARA